MRVLKVRSKKAAFFGRPCLFTYLFESYIFNYHSFAEPETELEFVPASIVKTST